MHLYSTFSRLVRTAAIVLVLAPCGTQAALVVSGPDSVAPGGTLALTIALDAALVAEIDTLLLSIETNNAGVLGVSAAEGALLGGGSFLANPAGGIANMAFLTTLNALGPGELASWTFAVDLLVGAPQPLEFQATLQTFNLDDDLTAELVSGVKSVAVVPLPPALALLALPLALVGRRKRMRAGRRA